MIGVYLSGTGNTKHCVQKLIKEWNSKATAHSIEENGITEIIREHDTIVLGYPVMYSDMPIMMKDFIKNNRDIWKGKSVFCLSTMGLFSGDGSGCAARLLKKYGAKILGGLQIKMPDSISDEKVLKRTEEDEKKIVRAANDKIGACIISIKHGEFPQEGMSFMAHLSGLFVQRLWFHSITAQYSSKLKINEDCVGCGSCTKSCPMSNLSLESGRAVSKGQCTMCYRCVNTCPRKAITLLGKKVHRQYQCKDN